MYSFISKHSALNVQHLYWQSIHPHARLLLRPHFGTASILNLLLRKPCISSVRTITLGACSVSDHPPSHAAELDLLNDNLTEKAPITLLYEDDEARLPIHYRPRGPHRLPFLFGVFDEFAERAVRRGSCSGERTRRTSSGACGHSVRIFLLASEGVRRKHLLRPIGKIMSASTEIVIQVAAFSRPHVGSTSGDLSIYMIRLCNPEVNPPILNCSDMIVDHVPHSPRPLRSHTCSIDVNQSHTSSVFSYFAPRVLR